MNYLGFKDRERANRALKESFFQVLSYWSRDWLKVVNLFFWSCLITWGAFISCKPVFVVVPFLVFPIYIYIYILDNMVLKWLIKDEADVGLQWTQSPLKFPCMCLGRNLRGSLWKGAKVWLCGSSLEALACVVYWREWRPIVGVSLFRDLLKVGRMEVGSLNWKVVQMRQAGSYWALWLTRKQRGIV